MMSGRVCPGFSETSCRAPSISRRRLHPPMISSSTVGFGMAGMTPGSRDSACTPRRPSAGSSGRPSFVRTRPGKGGPRDTVHAAGFDVARHGETDIRKASTGSRRRPRFAPRSHSGDPRRRPPPLCRSFRKRPGCVFRRYSPAATRKPHVPTAGSQMMSCGDGVVRVFSMMNNPRDIRLKLRSPVIRLRAIKIGTF